MALRRAAQAIFWWAAHVHEVAKRLVLDVFEGVSLCHHKVPRPSAQVLNHVIPAAYAATYRKVTDQYKELMAGAVRVHAAHTIALPLVLTCGTFALVQPIPKITLLWWWTQVRLQSYANRWTRSSDGEALQHLLCPMRSTYNPKRLFGGLHVTQAYDQEECQTDVPITAA